MQPEQMKNELVRMLCDKSFQYSKTPRFKLVSGRMSRFYVNCKPTTLHPRGMYLVGHLMYHLLSDLEPEAVGGLTFGADPLAMATAFASQLAGRPIKAFSIRKARKDHGISKWIEGDLEPDAKVVVIDDVATTGGSTIKAIERAREEGLQVIAAAVLVDREEGGVENISRHVDQVRVIVRRSELMKQINEQPCR